jgi:ABC-2 type transport system ATP-binding protein
VEFGTPVEPVQLKKIKGVNDIKRLSAVSYQLSSGENKDIREDVFKFAVENGLTVLSLHREEQKLEEVFQELTRD